MATSRSATAAPTLLKAVENDALVEQAFRRLLSSLESERDKLRETAQRIDETREHTTMEMLHLREENERWCTAELHKANTETERLDKITDRLVSFWPESMEPPLEIKCSGRPFTLPRNLLCSVKESHLALMFSDDGLNELTRDPTDGRFILDFNPVCFSLMVDYLWNRRLRSDAPTPIVPAEQQHNMDRLAEALYFTPFLKLNRITQFHGTSLQVVGNTLAGSHPGWQIASAQYALSLVRTTYFDVRILFNPDSKGGLAVGLCGHVPQGAEVHSIHLSECAMYVSGNGPLGDAIAPDEAAPEAIKAPFSNGSVLRVIYDPDAPKSPDGTVRGCTIEWVLDGYSLAKVFIAADMESRMRSVYPVFAIYMPGQKIAVEFDKDREDRRPQPGALPALTA